MSAGEGAAFILTVPGTHADRVSGLGGPVEVEGGAARLLHKLHSAHS